MRKKGTGDIYTTITERKGVCEIEKRCCLINWVFRERGHSDFGIDADMEESVFIDDKYHLTNRHIAVQIKSGSSYTKKDRKGRYYFDIDDKDHANYWLGSDRPVIVMVYVEPKSNIGLADDDGLIGTVYWAQIKLSNLEKVTNRKSKNDQNLVTKSRAKHKYARVYLTEKFTKDSASAFSEIISSYIPTYDSDFAAPSVILNSNYFEKLSEQMFGEFSRITDYIDDFLSIVGGIKGLDSIDISSLSLVIENLWLHLLYNRNIVQLLIVRYLDEINQFDQIEALAFPEFKAYRDKAIRKTTEEITNLTDILDKIKKELCDIKEITFDQHSLHSLINQTCHSIDDYKAMLRDSFSFATQN